MIARIGNRSDVGEALRHRALEHGFRLRCRVRGGELRLRRSLQDSGREYHEEVDIEGRPVDPAQTRDLGREVTP